MLCAEFVSELIVLDVHVLAMSMKWVGINHLREVSLTVAWGHSVWRRE